MLSNEEQTQAFELAKISLEKALESQEFRPLPEHPLFKLNPKGELFQNLGCFVTLKINGHLRGCIGSIVSDEPLYLNIIQNAANSGLGDPRFPPISVMGPILPLEDPSQIELGVHGLIMRKENKQGLLLPQVPIEWNWDLKSFFEQTCVKAGLAPQEYLKGDVQIYYFRADVYSLNSNT